MDETLDDLAATEMSTGAWLQKFKQMKHEYLHHAEEEEEERFPDFEKHLTEKEEREMAEIFNRRKEIGKSEAKVTPEAKDEAKE